MKDPLLDITTFRRVEDSMIAKNKEYDDWSVHRYTPHLHKYKPDEIEQIISDSALESQQQLSNYYYETNGLYKRIILYYATLLKYTGLLIPSPSFGNKLSTPHISKRYYTALEYIDKVGIAEMLTRISLRVLIDGGYYGFIKVLDKNSLVIIDLPTQYCRSYYRDTLGNDIIDFNVTYFDSIVDEDARAATLQAYPDIITRHYYKWLKGRVKTPWIRIPSDMGIYFAFTDDARPMFLDVIPATIQYDEALDTERERELEEIRKIIVQKIPHLTTGELLFEPEEALEMHNGAVGMLKGNKNLSVLTTYADVEAIISKTSTDNVSSSLERILQNVYANAGVSSQIFAPTGTQAVPYSIKNDTAFMMILGNKYSRFFTYILNELFSNSNIHFDYTILPISYYNESEYITDTFKLAQSGYSFILPALATGITQRELSNIKDLENDVLNLKDKLIPLSSAYTQSAGEVGAPEKKLEEKSEKTIQNEDSLNHVGGSNE